MPTSRPPSTRSRRSRETPLQRGSHHRGPLSLWYVWCTGSLAAVLSKPTCRQSIRSVAVRLHGRGPSNGARPPRRLPPRASARPHQPGAGACARLLPTRTPALVPNTGGGGGMAGARAGALIAALIADPSVAHPMHGIGRKWTARRDCPPAASPGPRARAAVSPRSPLDVGGSLWTDAHKDPPSQDVSDRT